GVGRWQMWVVEVGGAEAEEDRRRDRDEPGDGRNHAAHAPEPLADVHRHVHLVRPGHQATERQRAEELVVIEPATLLDEDALRPGRETTAEAGEGDGEKGERERDGSRAPRLVSHG